jgi:hypothetical protein
MSCKPQSKKKNLNYISQLGTVPISPFSSEIIQTLSIFYLCLADLKFCVDMTCTTEHN